MGSQPMHSRSEPPILRKGAVLRGKVLKATGPGSVLIRIGGRVVTARTHVPLKPGAKILLGVQQNHGPVVLQVLPNSPGRPFAPNIAAIFSAIGGNFWKLLLSHLDHTGTDRKGTAQLKKLMSKLILELGGQPVPDRVKKLMDRSGLLWEAKLRQLIRRNGAGKIDWPSLVENDLKGALARSMTDPQNKDTVIIGRLFTAIEQLQLLNHNGRLEDGRLFLPLPIRLPDGEVTIAQLLIYPDADASDEKPDRSAGGFRLLLVLELTELGPLRVDLSLNNQRIRAGFMVAREPARQAVANELPLLKERLTDRGFSFEYGGCLLRDAQSVSQSPLIDCVQTVGVNFDCQI